MIHTVNSDFSEVDWGELPTPDRAFTDIPFGVYEQSQYNNPYNGKRREVEEYSDDGFPLRELVEVHSEVLAQDGIGLVCHSKHQFESIVKMGRETDGLRADFADSIVLYFEQKGPTGTPPLYAKRKLANSRYNVTLLQKEAHEFDHEYVKDTMAYPRRDREVDWHPCPFDKEVAVKLMESFGGEVWVDFTAGTGTVGLAAKDLGVDAILVEQDEDYYEKMVERVEAYRPTKMQSAGEW